MCVCVCVCVGHRPTSSSMVSPPYFLTQGLLQSMELTDKARLAGHRASEIFVSPPSQCRWLTGASYCAWLFGTSVRNPKEGSLDCSRPFTFGAIWRFQIFKNFPLNKLKPCFKGFHLSLIFSKKKKNYSSSEKHLEFSLYQSRW